MGLGPTAVIGYQGEDGNWVPVTTEKGLPVSGGGGGGGAVDWEDIENTPDFAPVATSGAYGDLSGTPSIPSTPGDIGAQPQGDYVTSDDSRLSDARTPTSHTHTISDIDGLQGIINGLEARLEALENPDPED